MAFEKRAVEWGGSERGYQVYVPGGISGPLPAILFLHGMGESGTDNEVQIRTGIGAAIEADPDGWPFLVVFPQKVDAGILWPSYRAMVDAILQDVEENFQIDRSRLYITGLSQGGNGTFTLAGALSWKFAAAAPICGWADPRLAGEDLCKIPLWVFHGEKDPVVSVASSTAVVDWVKRYGGNVRLSLLPEADHNSWDDAYQRSGLAQWFLSHQLVWI